jgi:hypothetical protein
MAAEPNIGVDKPFSTMTSDERDQLLLVLAQKLKESALQSHQLKSRHWQKLEKMANRIGRDREELANDYCGKSDRFVSDAVHALEEFSKEAHSYDRHPAART